MKKVYIFEKNCCGPSPSQQLVTFLQNKFRDQAEVKVFDLGRPVGVIPIPTSFLLKLQEDGGSNCLPALVVDDVVLTEGWLPNFLDAVEFVQNGKPAETVPPASKQVQGPTSCCP